jgi:hypothetical protein
VPEGLVALFGGDDVVQELYPGLEPKLTKLADRGTYTLILDPVTGELMSTGGLGSDYTFSAELGPPRDPANAFRTVFYAIDQSWTLPDGTVVELGSKEPMLSTTFFGEYDGSGAAVGMTRTAYAWLGAKTPYDSLNADGGEVGGVRDVVAGFHSGSGLTFGPGTAREATVELDGMQDAVLASYRPDGEFRCAWNLGGAESDHAYDAVMLPDGSVVVVGDMGDEMTIRGGDGAVQGTAYSGTDAIFDGYIARFGVVPPPAGSLP